MVHWPFPLHKLGQPSAERRGQEERGGREVRKKEKGRDEGRVILVCLIFIYRGAHTFAYTHTCSYGYD